MKPIILAAFLFCSSCATPADRAQVAYAATGTAVTVVGFAVVAAAGVALVPAIDEALMDVERENPGIFLGADAGPTCVAVGPPKYSGGFAGRGADRYVTCGD